VTTGSCNLERLSAFALLVDVDHLTWLDSEGRPVNALTINEDVAVNNQLTSLSHCAGETSTQH
jgi:hypothetical protein